MAALVQQVIHGVKKMMQMTSKHTDSKNARKILKQTVKKFNKIPKMVKDKIMVS